MKKLSVLVLGILALALGSSALAASFGAGNVVVYRCGDGTATLTGVGTVVFLDEYQTNGTFVQSIAMPTTFSGLNYPLIATGNSTTEGLMTRSTNGLYLVTTGYGTNQTGFAIASTTGTACRRVVGIVAADGTVDTTTATTDINSAGNVRGVASTDGTNIWTAGSTSGIRYVTRGQTTVTPQLSTSPLNLRGLSIYGDRLYCSTQSGAFRLFTMVGTAIPTTTGNISSNLTGFTTTDSAGLGFFMTQLGTITSPDTAYFCDGQHLSIVKWSNVAGSWTSNGFVSVPGLESVTGIRVSSSEVRLIASTITSIVSVVDTAGFNAAPTGPATTLATAAANKGFRGIAFAPVSAACPSLVCGSVSGASTVCTLGTNTYSVTPSGGQGSYTYSWSFTGNSGGSSFSGSTTASSVDVVAGTGASSYTLQCAVTDSCSPTPQSCNANSAGVSVTTSVTPSVTISSNGTNICSGSSVTFTATASNGGPGPSYNFRVNGGSVQSGAGTTYVTSGLQDGDSVDVILTSNDPCRSANTATSSSITMSVEDPPTGGTASYSGGNVCSGASATITLAGQIGTIQWQFAANAGTYNNVGGATSSSLITNVFSATNNFRAILSGTVCPSATSTVAQVILNVRPTVSITGASSVCSGTTNDYSATGAVDLTDTYGWTITSDGSASLDTASGITVAVASDSATTYSLVVTATGTNSCSRSVTNTVAVNTVVPSVAALFENFGTLSIPYPFDGWTVDPAGTGAGFWSNTTTAASSSPFSGGANVTITQVAATNEFLISPTVDFTGLTSGSVSVAVRKSATFTNNVDVEVSIDGGATFAAAGAITPGNAPADSTYHLVTISLGATIDNQSAVQIRFRLDEDTATDGANSGGTFRMDDFKLSGTTASAAISPAGTVNRCVGGSVILTATRGTSYLWSPGGETTQSITTNAAGAYTVAITYDNGCPALSSATTLSDCTGASVTCPSDISTNSSIAVNVTYTTPTPSGDCAGIAVDCEPASGSSFSPGTNVVTCTATDDCLNTNTCTFNVIVALLTNPCLGPVIAAHANISTNITPSCTAAITYTPLPTATAGCGAATNTVILVACKPLSGSTFKTGVTTVICTAKDSLMRVGTNSFTVTVLNTTPLSYSSFPTNITLVTCTNKSFTYKPAVVVFSDCLLTDTKVIVTNYCVPPSKTWFNQGTTTVNCYAQDKSGNTLSSNFVVTVADNVKPTIKPKVKNECIVEDCNGILSYTTPVYTDKCQAVFGPATLVCTPASGTYYTNYNVNAAATSNLVTCTVTDVSGNSASTNWWVIANRRVVAKWVGPSQWSFPSNAVSYSGASWVGNDLCAIVDTDAEPTNLVSVGISGGVTNVLHNVVKLYDLDNNDVTSDADVTGSVVTINFTLRNQDSPTSSSVISTNQPLVPKLKKPFTWGAGIGTGGTLIKPIGTMKWTPALGAFVFDVCTTNAGWNANTIGDSTFIRATVIVTPKKPLCTKSVIGTGEIRLETNP